MRGLIDKFKIEYSYQDHLSMICTNCIKKRHKNELRFINDYRNISPSSNVIIKTTYIDKKPRVLFVVTKKIEPGEQLLTDYGEGYWEKF